MSGVCVDAVSVNFLFASAAARGRSAHGQRAVKLQSELGAGRQNGGTVRGQPVGCGGAGSDCATDEDSGAPADEAANQHAAGRAAAGFEVIATVAGLSFELTFLINVGAANVGIGQRRVKEIAFASG